MTVPDPASGNATSADAPIDLDRIWKQMPKADRLVLLGTDADALSATERALFARLAAGLRTGTTPAVPKPRAGGAANRVRSTRPAAHG